MEQINKLIIASHCGVCKYYKAGYGSSTKTQDGKCELNNFKTHNRYVCKDFKLTKSATITRLNNNIINKIYGTDK